MLASPHSLKSTFPLTPIAVPLILTAPTDIWCRHQYSLSFISALMSRDGNKQSQTPHPEAEKLNFVLAMRLQDPRMATSTIGNDGAARCGAVRCESEFSLSILS